jgi:hypothetical protein
VREPIYAYASLTRNTLTAERVDSKLVIVMSKTRRYSILVLCLYFALRLAASVPGSVLCVAPDEGAKVEAVCQTSCSEAQGSCDAEPPSIESEVHAHCIDCKDFPLIYESLARRDFVSSFIDDSAQLNLTKVTHAEAADLTAARRLVPLTRGLLTSPHLSLSTIILIC